MVIENFDFPRTRLKLPVKLVVSDMVNTVANKRMRRLISPVLQQIWLGENFREFGIFHSAVIVGPWYLEWNASSLVEPREIYSRRAILCLDIADDVTCFETMEELAENLSFLVTNWNRKMYFSRYKRSPHQANCQDFVEDVLETLRVQKSYNSGAVGHYIKKMISGGLCEMHFSPSRKFRKAFKMKKKKYEFETHGELDKFVHDIITGDANAQNKCQNEWDLLRGFDRAYWLRYQKKQSLAPNQPREGGCPFGVPDFLKLKYVFQEEDNEKVRKLSSWSIRKRRGLAPKNGKTKSLMKKGSLKKHLKTQSLMKKKRTL